MAYQINLTGKEIDERLQNVGTPADNPDANGTLFARLNKNVDDVDALNDSVAHIQDAQAATDKTVAKHTADISALQTAVGNNKTEQDAIAQKVQQNAAAIGSVDDPNDAKGSLYARVKKANASTDVNRLAITTLSSANKKNQADITDIDSRQTNIEQVVSGAQENAYFSLRFLDLIVGTKFLADVGNIKVVLYRWSGKRYSELKLFTKNGFGESQKTIQYVIILKQDDVNGVNKRTPYIHYNDDATEETLVDALKNAFGGRISYRKNKKKRWRLQAFLNGRPITAPFDFRVSVDFYGNVSLTKGGMMRSVPSSDSVVYDGLFNGSQWLRCKKGDLLDLSYSADAGILFPPTPGNVIGGDNNAKGCVVAVKNITQDARSVTVLWTVGDSLYEIGVEERTESDEYVHRCTSPAKKLCDDIYDYASKMNSGTLRDLYISAGAKYNEATGYYELNGLTDITEEEMGVIYEKTWGWWLHLPSLNGFGSALPRTNIPCPDYKIISYASNISIHSIFSASGNDDNLEVVNLRALYTPTGFDEIKIVDFNWAFQVCKKIREVQGIINVEKACYDLNIGGNIETINIKGLKVNIRFYNSQRLSKESVLYMINNSAATSAITISLNKAVYDVMKDDADIIAALAEKTNITLVQNT